MKRNRKGAERSPILQRGTFGSVTDGWWALITEVFAEHGWTAADIVYAVDHLPDGTQHYYTDKIRVPEHRGGAARLLRWRLAQWLYKDGTPVPSPSRQRADRARAAREARERRHAELGLGGTAAKLRASRDYDSVRPEDTPPPRHTPSPRTSAPGRTRQPAGSDPRDLASSQDRRPRSSADSDLAWQDALAASAAAVDLARKDPAFADALENELNAAEADGREPQWRSLLDTATARASAPGTEASG